MYRPLNSGSIPKKKKRFFVEAKLGLFVQYSLLLKLRTNDFRRLPKHGCGQSELITPTHRVGHTFFYSNVNQRTSKNTTVKISACLITFNQ